MSSAAKLRQRGTAAVAATALVMTAFGPVAFASWDDAPQTPSVVDPIDSLINTRGTIGLVDSDQKVAGTQGAKMVMAGADNQAISDVRLVIPNRFKKGDTIDLRIFDRSATEETSGNTNSGPTTKVEFSTAPKVDSVSLSNKDTTVSPTNPANNDVAPPVGNAAAANTESGVLNPWKADAGATGTKATQPGQAPAFDVETFSNGSHGYKDGIRLTVNTDASTGDQDAVWVVTLKELKVNLGAKVTPGALRLVPFAYNTNVRRVASPWFNGNAEFNDNGTVTTADDIQREVGIYTVPAWVSPVKIEYGTRDIMADGIPQAIGDITLSETQDFAWKDGNLVLKIGPTGSATPGDNVTIATPASQLKVTVNGKDVTLADSAVDAGAGTITIPVSGFKVTSSDTVTIKGVQLRTSKAQAITYAVDSTSTAVNDWLSSPAGGSPEIMRDGGRYAYADVAFLSFQAAGNVPGSAPETNRPVNVAASFAASTTPAATVAGPTAISVPGAGENILDDAADWTVAAGLSSVGDGTTTLNLSTGTLVQNADGSFNATYVGNVPGAGNNAAETYEFRNIWPGVVLNTTNTLTVLADGTPGGVVSVTPAKGANSLPAGSYNLTGISPNRTLSGPSGVSLVENGTAGEFGATPVKFTNLPANATQVTIAATYGVARSGGAAPTSVGVTQTGGAGTLPTADYTVAADGSTITGGGVTLARQGSTNTYRVTATGGTTAVAGDDYLFNGITNGGRYRIVADAITAVYGSSVTVTSGANNLAPGEWTVTAAGTDFTLAGPNTASVTNVQNGIPKSGDWDGNGAAGVTTVTFQGLTGGQTFTVPAGLPTGNVNDIGVNQRDIIAPLDALAAEGLATSESARVGGNNRYETAAKIANLSTGGTVSTAGQASKVIIASGQNFPDALSASYLSQRMGAPVLLTMANTLPDDTMKALRALQVQDVYIVGGESAVSAAVAKRISELPAYLKNANESEPKATDTKLSVLRLGGGTRYTTNQLVNMYAAAWGGNKTIGKTVYKQGEAGKYTAIFARGDKFPDAMAAGVLTAGVAGQGELPLVLVEPNTLPQSAKDQIERLDVQHGLIIGSENAISSGVKKAIEDEGVSNTRIEGKDRYFTAAAVNEFAMRDSAPSPTNEYPGLGFLAYVGGKVQPANQMRAFVANGLDYPDALAAAPWIGDTRDALLLVQPKALTDGSKDFLTKRSSDINQVLGLGLGDAVHGTVLQEANKLASAK